MILTFRFNKLFVDVKFDANANWGTFAFKICEMFQSAKSINKIDSTHIVNYLLTKKGAMSHLKLQKLLYYIEGHHLAYFEESLMDDEFEAWVHGPVSRKIFNAIKEHSLLYDEIVYKQEEGEPNPKDVLHQTLSTEQIELIDEVIDSYGGFTGMQLENMTHKEFPWLEARRGFAPGDKCNQKISKVSMHSYFTSLVNGEE